MEEVEIGYVKKGRHRRGKRAPERERIPALRMTCQTGAVLLRPLTQDELEEITRPPPSITVVHSSEVSMSARQMSIPTVGVRKSAQIGR